MPDLLPALAERLLTVARRIHLSFDEADADVFAREALTVVAERLPTREEVAVTIETAHWPQSVGSHERALWIADALLRDLRERLGVK